MRQVPAAERSDASFALVAVASSAGGFAALKQLLSDLSADIPAALLIVQHLDPKHRSLLAELLDRRSALPVTEAKHGDVVTPGHAFVAPPDHHLLVDPDHTLVLTRTELVHFVRPSADLLFESVAATFGPRAIAVVLSGTGLDGSMGVKAVKKMGGSVIAQDEGSSDFFGMPSAAIMTGDVDVVAPVERIASVLQSMVRAWSDR